ncbi:hypothetical protein A6U96_13940 [Agrobacterium tumefaciens]|nr:hypothetical protein A6U96_13940 [Agrobacterium tumefaciens]
MVLASEITEGIYKNYWCYEDDRRIGHLEMTEAISNWLWEIPDDLAKAAGTKLSDISAPALEQVAIALAEKMETKWRIEFVSMDKHSIYYRG